MLSVAVKGRVRVNKEGEEDIKSGDPLLMKNVIVVESSDADDGYSASKWTFKMQDCIIVEDENGREIARAIANYSADDLRHDSLRNSDGDEEFVHSSNLCVTHFNDENRSVSRGP
jgi:glutamate 5-kinase